MVDMDTTGSAELDEQRGLWSVKKEMKKNWVAGMWGPIEVYAGEAVDTKPLKREFEGALRQFMSTVCFLVWSTTMLLICFGLQVKERAEKREEDTKARKAVEDETAHMQKEAEEEQKAKDAEIAHLKKKAEEDWKAAEERQKAVDAEIACLQALFEGKRPK